MKFWQKHLIVWSLAFMFFGGWVSGWLACTKQVKKQVEEILDSKCITTYDKQNLCIMDNVCRKVVAGDPVRYWQEKRYYDLWRAKRFADYNHHEEAK